MKKYSKTPSLAACILMDILGYATYAVPFVGELADIIWAPISALIFFRMFGGWKGAFGGMFNFIEEILPGLDFIPTFTITWLWQYFTRPKVENEESHGTFYLDQHGRKIQPVTKR
jgi:hypothetical protein